MGGFAGNAEMPRMPSNADSRRPKAGNDDRRSAPTDEGPARYFSMMREPRTRVVLSVFRKDGSTASICSKNDDRAGTFCWLG